MAMVCGLDLHRRQITFDALEVMSGEEWRGRIWQPDRERFRRWLRSDLTRRAEHESVALAVEGCSGWRYVVEEIEAAGFEAHLAEPADTQAARGRKHRAKTDRTDARLLRDLLAAGELPASWMGLLRGPVTSDLWCRKVPLEGCALCPSPIPGSSGRT